MGSRKNHEQGYKLSLVGAVDNAGGSGVAEYVIYRIFASIPGNGNVPSDSAANFTNAVEIGRLGNLDSIQGYSSYDPGNTYEFIDFQWKNNYCMAYFALSVDKAGNIEVHVPSDGTTETANYTPVNTAPLDSVAPQFVVHTAAGVLVTFTSSKKADRQPWLGTWSTNRFTITDDSQGQQPDWADDVLIGKLLYLTTEKIWYEILDNGETTGDKWVDVAATGIQWDSVNNVLLESTTKNNGGAIIVSKASVTMGVGTATVGFESVDPDLADIDHYKVERYVNNVANPTVPGDFDFDASNPFRTESIEFVDFNIRWNKADVTSGASDNDPANASGFISGRGLYKITPYDIYGNAGHPTITWDYTNSDGFYPATGTPPADLVNVTHSSDDDGAITLEFDLPSDDDLRGIQIERQAIRNGTADSWELIVDNDSAGFETGSTYAKKYIDPNLEPYSPSLVEYKYRIRGTDFSGNTSLNWKTFNSGTAIRAVDITVDMTGSSLSLAAKIGAIAITITPPSDGKSIKCRLFRSVNDNTSYESNPFKIVEVLGTSVKITQDEKPEVDAPTLIYYKAKFEDKWGNVSTTFTTESSTTSKTPETAGDATAPYVPDRIAAFHDEPEGVVRISFRRPNKKNLAGTVGITNGSTALVGTGTAFLTDYTDGEDMEVLATNNGDKIYRIATVTDNTNIVLSANVAESTGSSLSYRGSQDYKGAILLKRRRRADNTYDDWQVSKGINSKNVNTVEDKALLVGEWQYGIASVDTSNNESATGNQLDNGLALDLVVEATNDVYIYNTANDTIDGSWKFDDTKSWFNETLDQANRGSTRPFPEVAILVATDANLYIFDAFTGSMWMRFDVAVSPADILGSGGADTVFALNGKIYVGGGASNTVLNEIDFVNDIGHLYDATRRYLYNGNISQRVAGSNWTNEATSWAIVNNTINDIHAAVIGGKTYVLVGTDGGATGSCSLINETDGVVYDIGTASKKAGTVHLAEDGTAYIGNSTDFQLEVYYDVPQLTGDDATPDVTYDETSTPAIFTTASEIKSLDVVEGTPNKIHMAHAGGVTILEENSATQANGLTQYISKDYNTLIPLQKTVNSKDISFWDFSTIGATIDDVTVNSNDLTRNGVPVTGTIGALPAVDFGTGNTDKYLEAADAAWNKITGSFTIVVVADVKDIASDQTYLAKWNATVNKRQYALYRSQSGNEIQVYVSSDGTDAIFRKADANYTGKTAFIGRYDASIQTLDLFINGELANGTLTGTVPSSIFNGDEPFRIGALESSGITDFADDKVFAFILPEAKDDAWCKNISRLLYELATNNPVESILLSGNNDVRGISVDESDNVVWMVDADGDLQAYDLDKIRFLKQNIATGVGAGSAVSVDSGLAVVGGATKAITDVLGYISISDTRAPLSPEDVDVIGGIGRLTYGWNRPAASDIDNYRLVVRNVSDQAPILDKTVNGESYTQYDVTDNKTTILGWEVQITVTDLNGNSSVSLWMPLTDGANTFLNNFLESDGSAPAAPGTLTGVNQNDNDILVTFTTFYPSDLTDIEKFILERKESTQTAGVNDLRLFEIVVERESNGDPITTIPPLPGNYRDVNIVEESGDFTKLFNYRLVSISHLGKRTDGAYSANILCTDTTAPDLPALGLTLDTNFFVEFAPGAVIISFDDVINKNGAAYEILRSPTNTWTTEGTDYERVTTIASVRGNTNSIRFTDYDWDNFTGLISDEKTDLADGSYSGGIAYYRIKGIDRFGNRSSDANSVTSGKVSPQPYRPALPIDAETTLALFSYNKGVGSTSGLYPSNLPQIFLDKQAGKYGGAVQIAETPDNILEFAALDLMKDIDGNMEDNALGIYKAPYLDFNGSTDIVKVTHHADFNYGLDDDFSLEAVIRCGTQSSEGWVVSKGGNGANRWYMGVNTDGTVSFQIRDTGITSVTSTLTVDDNLEHHIFGVADRDTDLKIYIDGILDGTEATATNDKNPDNGQVLGIGSGARGAIENPFTGRVIRDRVHNRAVNAADALYYSKNFPLKNEDRWGSQTEISSGNLTVGQRYKISARTDADFTADGAPDNNVGTEFVATGTSVTLDAGDKVFEIGCIAEHDNSEGAGGYSRDKSSNGHTGVHTGITWVTDTGLLKTQDKSARHNQSLKLPNTRMFFEVDVTYNDRDYLFSALADLASSKNLHIGIEGLEILRGTTTSATELTDTTLSQFTTGNISDTVRVKNVTTGTYGDGVRTSDTVIDVTNVSFIIGDSYEVITHNGSGYLTDVSLAGAGKFDPIESVIDLNTKDNRLVVTVMKNLADQSDDAYLDMVHIVSSLMDDGGLEGNYTAGLNDGLATFGASTVSEETTLVHSGESAQKFTADGDSSGLGQLITFKANTWYYTECWLRGVTGTDDLRDFIVALLSDVNGSPGVGRIDDFGTVYKRLSVCFQVVTDTSGKIQWIGDTNDSFIFDDASVIELNQDFDGDNRMLKYSVSEIGLGVDKFTFDKLISHDWDAKDGLSHFLIDTTGGASDQNRITLEKDSSDNLLFKVYGDTAAGYKEIILAVTESNFAKNILHKLSVRFDPSSDELKVFLNGIEGGTPGSGGTWVDPTTWGADLYIGSKNDGTPGDWRIHQLRIEDAVISKEDIRTWNDIDKPFFDPDPRTIAAAPSSYDNTNQSYSLDPKRILTRKGTVTITNGSATVEGDGTDDFTKMYVANEEIEFENTSSGDIRKTVQSVTDSDTLVLTANIDEETKAGLKHRNYTLRGLERINDVTRPEVITDYLT